MASVKIATLLIRTIAKPISAQLKNQAKQHESFRGFCVNLAQMMYRSEVKLRTGILGEPVKHIRPLSETRAIENGANALAEGFLFAVALSLILGETWRTSRNQTKRKDAVDDQLDDLGTQMTELRTRVEELSTKWESELQQEKQRNDELAKVLDKVVWIGLHGGLAEFQDTPLRIARVENDTQLPSIEELPRPVPPTQPQDTQIDDNTPNSEPADSNPKPPSSSSS